MFFKNTTEEKRKLIDRELEIYRKEKLVDIALDIANAQELGASQEREYECGWHERHEKLETELAVLEAKKEMYVSHLEEKLKNYVCEYKAVNEAKDKTIAILQDALANLTKRIITEVNTTAVIK